MNDRRRRSAVGVYTGTVRDVYRPKSEQDRGKGEAESGRSDHPTIHGSLPPSAVRFAPTILVEGGLMRSGKSRLRHAVLSAGIVLLALTQPPALAVGTDGPGEHGPAEFAPVREVEDLSIFDSMSFGPGLDPLEAVDRLAPLFGSRWLGWDLSGASPRRLLHLLLAPVTTGDDKIVSAVLGQDSEYVKIVPAPHSFEELLEYKELILSYIEEDPIADASMVGVGINNLAGQVEVVARAALPTLQTRIKQNIPPDAVDFQVDPSGAPVVADSYESFPPYKAGKRIKDKGVSSCTSSYVLRHRYSGVSYGSTAGHCVFPNNYIWTDYNNRDRIGFSFNDREAGRNPAPIDSALITIDNQSHASNKLYVNSNLTRSVVGLFPASWFKYGVPVCARGYRSGIVCGSIKAIERSVWTKGVAVEGQDGEVYLVTKRFDHQTCWTGLIQPGDSGGPVYFIPNSGKDGVRAYAVGINSNTNGRESCFDPMYNMLRVNGDVFTLRTS